MAGSNRENMPEPSQPDAVTRIGLISQHSAGLSRTVSRVLLPGADVAGFPPLLQRRSPVRGFFRFNCQDSGATCGRIGQIGVILWPKRTSRSPCAAHWSPPCATRGRQLVAAQCLQSFKCYYKALRVLGLLQTPSLLEETNMATVTVEQQKLEALLQLPSGPAPKRRVWIYVLGALVLITASASLWRMKSAPRQAAFSSVPVRRQKIAQTISATGNSAGRHHHPGRHPGIGHDFGVGCRLQQPGAQGPGRRAARSFPIAGATGAGECQLAGRKGQPVGGTE